MAAEASFGRWLQRRRKALDLTQEELAQRVGCAAETLRKIEADARRPSRQIAERLAEALELPADVRAAFIRAARAELAVDQVDLPIPLPAPPPAARRAAAQHQPTLKGYVLHEIIGTGGFGTVYRAEQLSVGREVALKVIRSDYVNQPDFIRRFEAEAQFVARLEHPHIVPLHDYWRDSSGAYLVMRYVHGGNLQQALADGPWPVARCSRLLSQIAWALQFAHQHSVVHRDLKPANILLDADGHAYLADFGIAKDLPAGEEELTQPGVVVGSPEYLSPEQIEDGPITPRTDIYSLGVLLYEMLTGTHPFAHLAPVERLERQLHAPLPSVQERQPDLPPVLDTIIQRATAKRPDDRYPNIASMVVAWQHAVASRDDATAWLQNSLGIAPTSNDLTSFIADTTAASDLTVTALATVENPYKGLRAFSTADAADFFGREALIQHLLACLAEPSARARFLAVVGPSGSGKSSVVRAGLLPALRRGGLTGSEHWFVIEMLPGTHPLEELEAALLRIAVNPPPSLLEQLQADQRGLARAIKRVLPAGMENELLLVIDQFEELFTLTQEEDTRAHFLDSLRAAIDDPHSRLRVVITLRADFYDRPLLYAGFGEMVRQHTEVVLPLTSEELEQAIIRPAVRAGVVPEPELVATIVADVGTQPGTLPLLQYALTELFERRVGGALTRAAYQATGGVRGALARRADEVYHALNANGQATARQLFLRLITLGEGIEDARRRVLQTELASMVGAGESLEKVLNAYGHYRLLTFDRDPITRGPTVEVAHEALIRTWGQLRTWLDTSRDNLRMQQRLAMAAAEWINSGGDSSFLARGIRLEQFRMLAEGGDLVLNTTEDSYIQTSAAEWEQHIDNERARNEHEIQTLQQLAEAEKQRADEQSRIALKLRQYSIALTAIALLAVLIGIAAVFLARSNARLAAQNTSFAATAQANFAYSENLRLAAAARSTLASGGSIEIAALLAIRSLKIIYSPQADAALLQALAHGFAHIEAEPRLFIGHTGNVYGVAFSPDGQYVLTGSADKTARLWDARSGKEVRQFIGHTGEVAGVAFSPDGKYVLTGSDDKTARLWDVQSGQEVRQFVGHKMGLARVAFSSEGKYVLTDSWDKTARIWDAQSGRELRQFACPKQDVFAIAISPDDKYVLTGCFDRTARLWDAQSGQELRQFVGHTDIVTMVAFSPDGKHVLTGSNDATVRLWDARSGQEVRQFVGHAALLWQAAFSSDGKYVLTGSADKTARLWDVQSGQEVRQFVGSSDAIGIALSPDGKYALTTSAQTAQLWHSDYHDTIALICAHLARDFSDAERTQYGIRDKAPTCPVLKN